MREVRDAIARIGSAEESASRSFVALLENHSYSTQVLRAYSQFLD